jgi:hypothetical protein
MKERRVWGDLLGLARPGGCRTWSTPSTRERVRIFVEVEAQARLRCPSCQRQCAGYDARERAERKIVFDKFHVTSPSSKNAPARSPWVFSAPEVVVEVKALACQLPQRLGIPLSRLHVPDIRNTLT